MVYIVVIYKLEKYGSEYIYNKKSEAYKVARQYRQCYTNNELHIEVYEAINEYTNKRYLIKRY